MTSSTREFTGYVRYARAYDTASMGLHKPEGWTVENRNGVIVPPSEASRLSIVPVRWVSGYPEPATWEEWWNNPSISERVKDASDRVFGTAQV